MLIGIISDDNDVHFEGIKNSIESSGREFDGFIKFGKLKKEFPIINFAILEYQNRYSDREVIFGWGHHSKERVACVFSSKDPKIVDLFMNFFECITDDDLCQWVWDNRNGDLTKTKDEKPI